MATTEEKTEPLAAPSAEVKESAEQTPNLDEEKTKTESQPTEDKKNAEQTATDHPEEKPREKTEEEKKQEFLERQTAIIVDSIREFVGGKRITSTEVIRVIAHGMSVAAKLKIDNKNKKIVVIAGVKAYINGTDWAEDDKIVLCEFVDLTISSYIDTVADVHKGKIDLTQPPSNEMQSKSISSSKNSSCCVVM